MDGGAMVAKYSQFLHELTDPRPTDVILYCDAGVVLRCHQFVLEEYSDLLTELFRLLRECPSSDAGSSSSISVEEEDPPACISLPEVKADLVARLLLFVYSREVTLENAAMYAELNKLCKSLGLFFQHSDVEVSLEHPVVLQKKQQQHGPPRTSDSSQAKRKFGITCPTCQSRCASISVYREHLSLKHYKTQLEEKFLSANTACTTCGYNGSSVTRHIGSVHKLVDEFLTEVEMAVIDQGDNPKQKKERDREDEEAEGTMPEGKRCRTSGPREK